MKKVLFFLVIVFVGQPGYTQDYGLFPTPSAYINNGKINFIRTWSVVKPLTGTDSLLIGSNLKTAQISTQYFDGLGRNIQTVIKQGSMITGQAPVDWVSTVLHDLDQDGQRKNINFLPFAANAEGVNTSVSDGQFKKNPFQQQQAFYSNPDPYKNPIAGQGETYFYSQDIFENSFRRTPIESFAPGNSWAGTYQNGATPENDRRSVKIKNYANTSNDKVRYWLYTDNIDSFGSFQTTKEYEATILHKTITINEQGNQVIEFKNNHGLTVLKKNQLTAVKDTGQGSGHAGWLCTYYIYDFSKRLRAVIQPRGVEILDSVNWNNNYVDSIINEQVFQYKYDGLDRTVMKKMPGAGTVYMVYDKFGRLVMTQDAKSRLSNKWVITKYDRLNRPIETGLWENVTSFKSHLDSAASSMAYPNTTANYEELSRQFYDSYDWLSIYGNPFTANRLTTYDIHFQSSNTTVYPYPEEMIQDFKLKGYNTGARIKVLGTNQYLYSISYYDAKGRVIQSQATNITGGKTINTTQYGFNGGMIASYSWTSNLSDNATQPQGVLTSFEYDDLGRLVQVKKGIFTDNGVGNIAEKKTFSQEYDALGQISKKILAPDYNYGAGLDSLRFNYNIRGWLLGINRDYAKDLHQHNYFGFDLGYDKVNNGLVNNQTYNQAYYNGNVAGLVWKSKGDGEKRKYDFVYDIGNRLLKADFTQYNGTVFNTGSGVDFSIKMGDGENPGTAYDMNGNIKRMQQWGLKINGSDQIDDLSYTYQPFSNKLLKVYDHVTIDNKLDDFTNAKVVNSEDYRYDANGNMLVDSSKNITDIHYNYLNLPELIQVKDKGTVQYVYDAIGSKLRKIVTENGIIQHNGNSYTSNIITVTTYIDGGVYESKSYDNDSLVALSYADKLLFTGMEVGRIRFKQSDSTFHLDYLLTDHLKNVRMVLTEEEQIDSYPVASMEAGTAAVENTFYANIEETRADKPAGYPTDTYTSPNDKVARVKAESGSHKIGPNITLKVMAGDKINLRANSWYKTGGSSPDPAVSPLIDLVTALAGGVTGVTSKSGGIGLSELGASGILNTQATAFLDNRNYTNSIPKAYLNWVLLDEQFKYIESGSGAEQVDVNEVFKTHLHNGIEISKSGYFYVYVSNETPNIDVFFDNLQITHIKGPILEETHYYPFGLVMKGISNKVFKGIVKNNFLYNGKEQQRTEFEDASGLGWYDYGARMFDVQIARWNVVDPLSEAMKQWSPYNYVFNNPVINIDPDGRIPNLYNGDPYYDWNTGIFHEGNWSNNPQGRITFNNTSGQYQDESGTIFNGFDLYQNIDKVVRPNLNFNAFDKYGKYINNFFNEVAKSDDIFLNFDGKTLDFHERLSNDYYKVLIFSADSGKPGKDGAFDYSTERQKLKDIGPIPEGTYYIKTDATQYYDRLSNTQKILGELGRGKWPGGTDSWGRVRTDIFGGTNVYGRSGFTIHGGTTRGSAGCIDISGGREIDFFKLIENSKKLSTINLYVTYD